MKIMTTILAFLAVGYFGLQERDGRFSPGSEALAETRRGAVRAEADDMPVEHWAGDYYRGDGLGTRATIMDVGERGATVRFVGLGETPPPRVGLRMSTRSVSEISEREASRN